MVKEAVLLFTGQGSQYTGMGLSFKNIPIAKKYWLIAKAVLKRNLRETSFYGSADEIKKTINCQPLLFINEYINSRLVLKNSLIGLPVSIMGGFSLGEINAYICSGTTNFINGLLIISKRCFLMHKCCNMYAGSMLAVLNKGVFKAWNKVVVLCKKLNLQVSNVNTSCQIVISGSHRYVNLLKGLLTTESAKIRLKYKVIFLKVSGGYHSSLMNQASLEMFNFINLFATSTPREYIFNNVQGTVFVKYETMGEFFFNVAKQIIKTVNLYKNISGLLKKKSLAFVELNKVRPVTNIVKSSRAGAEESTFIFLDEANILGKLKMRVDKFIL